MAKKTNETNGNEMILVKDNEELFKGYMSVVDYLFKSINMKYKPLYEKIGIGSFDNDVWQMIASYTSYEKAKDFIYEKIRIHNKELPSVVIDLIIKEKQSVIIDFAQSFLNFGGYSLTTQYPGHSLNPRLVEIDDQGSPFISDKNKDIIKENNCRVYLPKDFHYQSTLVLSQFANWYNGNYANLLYQFGIKPLGMDDLLLKLFYFDESSGTLKINIDGIIRLSRLQGIPLG